MTANNHFPIKIFLIYILIFLSWGDFSLVGAALIFPSLFSLWILIIVFLLNREISSNLQFHFIRSRFFPGELTLLEYNIMSTFYVLGQITIAKGHVTQADIQYAENLMDEFKIRPYSTAKLVIINSFNRGKKNTFRLKEVVEEFCQFFEHNDRARYYYFDYQLTAAMKEGQLLDEEMEVLTTIAEVLGMSEYSFTQKINSAKACFNFKRQFFTRNHGNYEDNTKSQNTDKDFAKKNGQKKKKHHKDSKLNELENGYDILGVRYCDDYKTIKKAYRLLIKEYHPDKFSAQEVPQAVISKAKEKSQEIIGAYDLICRVRGWK